MFIFTQRNDECLTGQDFSELNSCFFFFFFPHGEYRKRLYEDSVVLHGKNKEK